MPVQEILLVTDYQMVFVIFKMVGHIPSGLNSYISNTLIHTYIHTPSIYKYITHMHAQEYMYKYLHLCVRERNGSNMPSAIEINPSVQKV